MHGNADYNNRPKKPQTHPGEQCIKTVHFLPFSDVGVILSHTLQSQLLHKVNLVRLLQMGILKEKKIIHNISH